MNNFVDLLKRASALWWRVKILWPLGMLAALVGYGDTAVGGGNVNFSQPFPSDAEADMPPWVAGLAESRLVRDIVANPWPYVAGLVAVILVLVLVTALVGALAHGAMIRVADVADQGYGATLGDGLRVGAARMGPLFLLNLLLALPVILVVGGLAAAVAFSVVGAVASLGPGASPEPGTIIASVLGLVFCAIGLFLLLWVVGIVLGVWSRVAQRVCVVEGRGPLASLGRAWGLLVRNPGLTLLTWLFQAVLGGLVGFLMVLPALAIAAPAIFAVTQGGAPPAGVIVALVLYAALAGVVVGGLLTAYNSAVWTVMFRAFVARERPYESYGAG